jgi:chemosensory pili system protein ChpA (sensor histidine kinase/response regulator)
MPEDEAALGELRRMFHTLKGSGRMVGAELIGDFAWRVEDLLNRLVGGTLELTESMTAFVGEAVGHVPGLIEQLETGAQPAFDVALFGARAEALVSGRSEPASGETGTAPDAEEVEAAPELEAALPERGGEEMDPVLRDIFAKEAGEHLAAIREFLNDSGERAAPFAVTEELYRACHTLAGSANMAAVAPAVAVAAPLDRLVRRLHGDNEGMSADMLALCAAAADIFTRIIDIVRDGGHPELAVDDVAAALQQEHAEYVLRADAAADEEPAPVEAEAAPEPQALELDPEIAEIFQEEADEILERCEEVVEIWRSDLSAPEPLEELKRQLHTLKGGARLAGLADMGDFSHALEDLITDLGIDPASVSEGVNLFQRCLDELHRMRDGIAHGQAIAPPPELLSALKGEAPALGVESPAVESPSVDVGEAFPEVVDFDLSGAGGDEPEPVELVAEAPEREPVDVPLGEAADEGLPASLDVPLEEIAADAELPGEAPTDWIAAFGGPDWKPVPKRAWTFGPPPASSPQLQAIEWPREEVGPEVERPAADAGSFPAAASFEAAPSDELEPADEAFDAEAGSTQVLEDEGPRVEASGDTLEAPAEDELAAEADEAWIEATQVLKDDEVLPAASDEIRGEQAEDELAAEAEEAWTEATQVLKDDEALFAESDDTLVEQVEDEFAAEAEEAWAEATQVLKDDELPTAAAAQSGEADESAPATASPTGMPERPIELPTAAAPGFSPAVNEIRASTPAISARAEIARVDADLLENLLNNAGEVSIYRSRLEQQIGSIEFNLDELSQTVIRLREQLRKLEMESDAQVVHGQPDLAPRREGFDALEMDRYSVIQQLTRAMAETASDVSSLQHLLTDLTRDADTLLTQQSRVISELQDGLMSTRMVPFSRHVQRLNRIVRQAAREAGKQAELYVSGGENELDRQVMERMLGPFEHLLRNAIVHGIETPEERADKDKDAAGRVGIELRRDGAEMRIVVSDDGAGLNIDAIRSKAEAQGFIEPGAALDAEAAADLIFRPGFSTAIQLTLAAGRGVGMDVVANEIRQLGGSIRVESDAGQGLRFVIRLPYTRAITQALIMRAGDELFALPLPTVEGIARVGAREVGRHIGDDAAPFEYGGHSYRVRHLASLVDGQARPLPADDSHIPVVLVRAGEHSTAVIGDEMLGAREIVVKTLGPQFNCVPGVAGATILGDGSIVVILDAASLIRAQPQVGEALPVRSEDDARDGRTFVMVVDDSITVRRVTERLLERNGMRVITAKDGVDAVSLLREHRPDIMLLDIEMPRMDGYEVANHVRNDPRLQHIPIVMITSRVGQKHRARAMESGVNDYLGKPYQENQLLAAIGALVDERRVAGAD